MKNPICSPACYTALYPMLVAAAQLHGYALGIHGSMTRDFDLIAAPWTNDASEPIELIRDLKAVCGGVFHHSETDHLVTNGNPTPKPHGRIAYVIHLTNQGCEGPYLDISVMPRI